MLVSAPVRGIATLLVDEHLEELGRLTDTAGGIVVGSLRQWLDRPNPATLIGKGKVQELLDLVQSLEADLVIFDEELTPGQGMNLEKALDCRVMDRAELILDIFATRARTAEAKLQVELAQLEYLLPRLRRMWSHLSRIRGGIGLRGPGETQLEVDRRLVGARIAELKRRLRQVAKARETQRQAREGSFRAALVGYTNAGKSSLLKALSGADLFVEDRLFATLDSATRTVELGDGHEALVTDTVGFIRKLPHHLVASFRSTLEEAREADVILHVVDASLDDSSEHRAVVREVLDELDLSDVPRLLVFNKCDRLTHAEEEAMRGMVQSTHADPSVFVSAHDQSSLGRLREALKARIRNRLHRATLLVPVDLGGVLAELYREGGGAGARGHRAGHPCQRSYPPVALQPTSGEPSGGGPGRGDGVNERLHIVGPGRMGLALGSALMESGEVDRLVYVGRRDRPPAHPLFEEGRAEYRSGFLLPDPGTTAVILTVPDSSLRGVAGEIASAGPGDERAPIFHAAGALGMDVLDPLHEMGWAVGSFHPLLPIGDPVTSAARLRGGWYAIAGEPAALHVAKRLLAALEGHELRIPAAHRALYHAAAATGSYHLQAAALSAVRLLEAIGVEPEDARGAILSLARGSLANLEELPAEQALTGPIVRGDVDTVRMHLQTLEPRERQLYRPLARSVLALVPFTGTEEQFRELEVLLGEPEYDDNPSSDGA